MKTGGLLLVAMFCLAQGAAAQGQIGRDIDGEAAGDLSDWSASGKFYRIEESEDLRLWSIREFRLPGTGENIQRFIPMRGPKLFLRVQEE